MTMPVPTEQPMTVTCEIHSSSEGPTPDAPVQLSPTVPEVSHLTCRPEGSMSSAVTMELFPTVMVDGLALSVALGVGVSVGVGTGVSVGVAVGVTTVIVMLATT